MRGPRPRLAGRALPDGRSGGCGAAIDKVNRVVRAYCAADSASPALLGGDRDDAASGRDRLEGALLGAARASGAARRVEDGEVFAAPHHLDVVAGGELHGHAPARNVAVADRGSEWRLEGPDRVEQTAVLALAKHLYGLGLW